MDKPKTRGSIARNPADTKYSMWEWARAYAVLFTSWFYLFPIMFLLNGRTLPKWITRKLLLSHNRTTEGRGYDVRIPGLLDIPAYMLRWWKVPRNWALNCYYHIVQRSDDDTAHHDHPWWSFSIVLEGGYFEERILAGGVYQRKWYGPGTMLFRPSGKFAHRLVLATAHVPAIPTHVEVAPGVWLEHRVIGRTDAHDRELPVKTIFLTGPAMRRWGFHHSKQWVDAYEWDDYCWAYGLTGHKMAGYAAQLNQKKD